MEQKVEGMEKTLNHIKDMLEKANVNHFVEEEYELNMRFGDEAKGIQMIVDSYTPVSIAISKWIERYLKEIEVKKDEIMEKECNRKFKIGENII